MNKSSVVFVVNFFPISTGGAELQSYQIATEMKKKFNVHFITIDPSVKKVRAEIINGFTVWRVPRYKFTRRLFGKNQFLHYWNIKSILQEVKPDYVYQRCAGFHTWICGILKDEIGYRFTFHMAADFDVQSVKVDSFKSLIYAIEKRCIHHGLKFADKIFVQNEFQEKGCASLFNRPDCQLVYNFSYPPTNSLTKNNTIVHVAWVANIKPIKRPELFVQLARRFQNDSRVRFTMIGTPGAKDVMELIYETVQNQSNFEYLGYIPNEQVNSILEDSHILVNTSPFEGFSNVFVQAWFRGCAVASLNANPDNLITKHSIGFCADGSLERLINFINNFIGDKQLQFNLSSNALKFANQYLSAENVLPEIIRGITG